MGFQKGTMFEWILTMAVAFTILWVRMVIHYVGQYVYLKVVDAPVTRVEFRWYKIKLIYSFHTMYQQLGVLITGTLANTLIFMFLMLVCHLSNKYIYCFPVKFCKLIAWYGLATTMDFLLITVIDMANQDQDSDLLKLYNYYEKT